MSETKVKPKRITRALAKKVVDIVDKGLCQGEGNGQPGNVCVEVAVSLAFGLPATDKPPCVHPAVRAFKIPLNDSAWSSNEARAKGMRKLAVAQLGTDSPDFKADVFVREVVLAATRKIVPLAIRAAAKANPKHADKLLATIPACEKAGDLSAARAASAASYEASDAASFAASDAARAASYAARAASDAASDAARAASFAASDAASFAASDAVSYAARAASDAASFAASDEVLTIMADAGLEALKLAGAKGCEFLDLVE